MPMFPGSGAHVFAWRTRRAPCPAPCGMVEGIALARDDARGVLAAVCSRSSPSYSGWLTGERATMPTIPATWIRTSPVWLRVNDNRKRSANAGGSQGLSGQRPPARAASRWRNRSRSAASAASAGPTRRAGRRRARSTGAPDRTAPRAIDRGCRGPVAATILDSKKGRQSRHHQRADEQAP